MSEIADKQRENNPDPVITDLNMTIAQMKMSGMTKTQIANKLGLTLPDILYHLKRVDTLMELSRKGDIGDPVNSHRARLQKNFKRMEQVYDHVLKPGKHAKADKPEVPGWKTNFQRLKLATDLAVNIDKGTGVFAEHKEVSGKIDILADRREQAQAQLDACQQFGLEPSQEIMAEVEIIDNGGDKSTSVVHDSPADSNSPEIGSK